MPSELRFAEIVLRKTAGRKIGYPLCTFVESPDIKILYPIVAADIMQSGPLTQSYTQYLGIFVTRISEIEGRPILGGYGGKFHQVLIANRFK
jgi:hypothetical protein